MRCIGSYKTHDSVVATFVELLAEHRRREDCNCDFSAGTGASGVAELHPSSVLGVGCSDCSIYLLSYRPFYSTRSIYLSLDTSLRWCARTRGVSTLCIGRGLYRSRLMELRSRANADTICSGDAVMFTSLRPHPDCRAEDRSP